jgi:hypothetical protein
MNRYMATRGPPTHWYPGNPPKRRATRYQRNSKETGMTGVASTKPRGSAVSAAFCAMLALYWIPPANAQHLPDTMADTPESERLLNCRAIPEDCAAEIAEVERMIGAIPALAALRQESDAQIAALKRQPGVTPAAARALDGDESWFRRNLKRELFFAASETETNRAIMEAALRYRRDMLRTITLRADTVAGEWRNATGTVTVAASGDGQYGVEASPVDIDDLGWTCELAGTGTIKGDRLVVDLGDGEILVLQVVGGILRTEHKAANGRDVPPSQYCGAGGHGAGLWFKVGAR